MKLCVIGAGRAGAIHARNLAERISSAELVALCDRDAAGLNRLGEELGVSARLADFQEAVARPDFDPGYAVEFWDIINRQDWSACESVQRGLSSPHASPGPLAPDEDAVYSFVTTIARGYLGQIAWGPVA